MTSKILQQGYEFLHAHFGQQNWWPAESAFETCVGAILVQNTSWRNVELAIANLKLAQALSWEVLSTIGQDRLEILIKPAGSFRIKAMRLRKFFDWIKTEHENFDQLTHLSTSSLREGLLSVSGIGPETADAMLLYAWHREVFVVDAYTKRILMRHRLIDAEADYSSLQDFFHSRLPEDLALFQDYHAQIVQVAKTNCLKSAPKCESCPLREWNGGPQLD